MSKTEVEIAELNARQARLVETRRWQVRELKEAKKAVRAFESGIRSIDAESHQIDRTITKLRGWI